MNEESDVQKYFLAIGYTNEEIDRVLKHVPVIYNYSVDSINHKINDLINLGYSKEEVVKMTKSLPEIFLLSIEALKQKIDFFDSVGLHEMVPRFPFCLMQSSDLIYARYKFYSEGNLNVDISNCGMLFVNEKQFEDMYGITKNDLLEKYNYNSYLEENTHERTI